MMDTIVMYLTSYIGTYFITLFFIYCWKQILQYKNSKLVFYDFIVCFIITIFTSCSLAFIKIYPVKIILNMFILVLFNYYLYSHSLNKSITMVLLLQILTMVSEVIYAIVGTIIFNINVVSTDTFINMINSIGTVIISCLIWKTGQPKKIYYFLINSVKSLKRREIITTTTLMMLVAIISTMAVYLKWNYVVVLSINTILIIIFIFISIKFASAKNKYNEISNKYETSISSLRQYEAMIDKYRIYNHENKNELQTLRNLISKKNTKALKYIDGILEDKIKDNEKIMHKTFKIPEGGLRAIIYGKLCKMDELGIKYSLDIARDVRTVDLINMNEEIVLNICKILGVFLDNAIEAVKNLKDKQITIEIYLMDGKLCIDITNNFEGKLELDKLDKEKYTTKGKNHGYGLSLVKQIIGDNSNIFENEKSISRNNFIQKLKIKM